MVTYIVSQLLEMLKMVSPLLLRIDTAVVFACMATLGLLQASDPQLPILLVALAGAVVTIISIVLISLTTPHLLMRSNQQSREASQLITQKLETKVELLESQTKELQNNLLKLQLEKQELAINLQDATGQIEEYEKIIENFDRD